MRSARATAGERRVFHAGFRLDKPSRHAKNAVCIFAPKNPTRTPMSTLSARIIEDMKNAMKAKDTVTLNVVRNLKSAMKYAAIEKHGAEGELDDAEAVAVVRKEIKKRQDSIASYEQAARQDLADIEKAEMAVLEKYLPAGLSGDEIVKMVEAVIAELGAASKKDMGAVMKKLQELAAGRADGRALSAEVAKRLQ